MNPHSDCALSDSIKEFLDRKRNLGNDSNEIYDRYGSATYWSLVVIQIFVDPEIWDDDTKHLERVIYNYERITKNKEGLKNWLKGRIEVFKEMDQLDNFLKIGNTEICDYSNEKFFFADLDCEYVISVLKECWGIACQGYEMNKKDKNDWSYFLEKGEYFESQNNFDEALKYYEEMIRLFPQNYNGWFKRGLIRRKNNDIKGAIEDYTKSISLEPVYQAFANRAVAFLTLNDNESALKDLNEALKLNPNDDIALRNRGQLKISRGEFLESINDFDEAIKISPENPHGFHCRAFAKYHINDKRGAQEDWNKAVDMGYEISSKALKYYFHE